MTGEGIVYASGLYDNDMKVPFPILFSICSKSYIGAAWYYCLDLTSYEFLDLGRHSLTSLSAGFVSNVFRRPSPSNARRARWVGSPTCGSEQGPLGSHHIKIALIVEFGGFLVGIGIKRSAATTRHQTTDHSAQEIRGHPTGLCNGSTNDRQRLIYVIFSGRPSAAN